MSAGWRSLLADVERAATATGRAEVGCFPIEGFRLHERALAAGVVPRSVLVGEEASARGGPRLARLLERLREAGAEVRRAPDGALVELTEGRSAGEPVGLVPLRPAEDLSRLVGRPAGRPWLALVAVDVDDPGNVGALVRTALAAGAAAFVGVGRGDPYHPKAVRTSMGSLFRLPLVRFADAATFVERARRLGIATIAAVARGGLAPGDPRLPRGRVALCLGNESQGLDLALVERLEARVTIPMGSPIDSYSINAAAAILLWELGGGGRSRA